MLFLNAIVWAASLSAASTSDSTRCWTRSDSEPARGHACAAPSDTTPRRRRSVQYSEWYARRLQIHRIGSYTMLPLFATEYVLGNQLLNGSGDQSTTKGVHVAVATGIGALFTINTVTGVWNLWESRSDPAGRTRRTIHAVTMLASDAGFLWTAAVADGAKRSDANARRHRNVALASIGISTAGTVMMWFWKD
jgi:hypothetical protein